MNIEEEKIKNIVFIKVLTLCLGAVLMFFTAYFAPIINQDLFNELDSFRYCMYIPALASLSLAGVVWYEYKKFGTHLKYKMYYIIPFAIFILVWPILK